MTTPAPLSAEARIVDIEVECRLRMTKIRQVARMKDVLQLNDVRLDEEGDPQIVLKRIEGASWSDVIDDEGALQYQRSVAQTAIDHTGTIVCQHH